MPDATYTVCWLSDFDYSVSNNHFETHIQKTVILPFPVYTHPHLQYHHQENGPQQQLHLPLTDDTVTVQPVVGNQDALSSLLPARSSDRPIFPPASSQTSDIWIFDSSFIKKKMKFL